MGDAVAGDQPAGRCRRSAHAVAGHHDGTGRDGGHPCRGARHRPGHQVLRQRQLRRRAGGRLRSAALFSQARGRRGAGEGRGRPARTAPAPADLRLLSPGARGRAFHALGQRSRRPQDQARALPRLREAATARRLHRADVRPQPRRDDRPDPVAMRCVRRGLRPAGHGHGVRFLRYPRQHRFGRCRCRPARESPAPARGHAGRRFP